MTIRVDYNGGSFVAGAVTSAVYFGGLPQWALMVAVMSLFSFGPRLNWNSGRGWRVER